MRRHNPIGNYSIIPPSAYGVIYLALCLISGRAYIGKSIDLPSRIRDHKSGKGGCRAFANAIAKHGVDSIQWRVIGIAFDKEALDNAEIFAIRHYGTMKPNGYNLTEGGEGGKMAAEVVARRNATRKANGWFKPETLAKLKARVRVVGRITKPPQTRPAFPPRICGECGELANPYRKWSRVCVECFRAKAKDRAAATNPAIKREWYNRHQARHSNLPVI